MLKYKRHITSEIEIGDIPVGGTNPVRLQSMTNTNTLSVDETVNQIIRIANEGADYIRLTVPTIKDVESLIQIKKILKEKAYENPLIADIHFSPKVAEKAAQVVEKIRINPGNYTDTKKFVSLKYTDNEYTKELNKIKENIIPLINICKKYETVIRIGANHGSLSDRIMSKYGDTPEGMAESVMEFLRICIELSFNNIVVSMKASNPVVMIHSTRLLVKKMGAENMNFPVHLGVTEAGSDEEGRIKSAVGISALLADGIGDTIRVSLTEDPENEIPVAKTIIQTFNSENLKRFVPYTFVQDTDELKTGYKKRESINILNIGSNNVPVVISDLSNINDSESKITLSNKDNLKVDYYYTGKKAFNYNTEDKYIVDIENWNRSELNSYPLFDIETFLKSKERSDQINFLNVSDLKLLYQSINKIKKEEKLVLVADIKNQYSKVHATRQFFLFLEQFEIKLPVIIKYSYPKYDEKMMINAAGEAGTIFIDGFGDGLWLKTGDNNIKRTEEITFGILQASRARISTTEYISCPSCGRTQFDLQKTTALIKEKT